jgi:hypothetical protein
MPLTVSIDSTTWAALALVLTIIGGALSWVVYQRRGLAAGIRGLAWTLIPVAAWLTGTLKLAVNILNDVSDWAARLVFSPAVWAGIIVAGASGALFLASSLMRARDIGVPRATARKRDRVTSRESKEIPVKRTQRHESDLDDMADIEAILKKHGI